MKRLNIFVDETGEFGFVEGTSRLYGVSFVFHEQVHDINNEIDALNNRLNKIGYNGMIHIADLVMHRGDYAYFSINKRESIFNAIYTFSKRIDVNYYSIIIDKKYTDNYKVLKRKLKNEVIDMINTNDKYFNSFNEIIMYYDNGQEILGKILTSSFQKYNNFKHIESFNHTEKKLFQVADMLTFIDKHNYKKKHKIQPTKSEKYFFKEKEIRIIIKELNKKKIIASRKE